LFSSFFFFVKAVREVSSARQLKNKKKQVGHPCFFSAVHGGVDITERAAAASRVEVPVIAQ